MGFKLSSYEKEVRNILLCVDFCNLHCALDKDNYHVPSMEHILQIVFGA